MTRFLWNAERKFGIRLNEFDGGNLRNAIPREAQATVLAPENMKEEFLSAFKRFAADIKFEFEHNEPYLKINIEETAQPEFVTDENTQKNLFKALYGCPHGILEWSTRMEGMVETSTNLASVKYLDDNKIMITTSQRSELESRKFYAAEMVKSVFELAGAEVTHTDGYPGWTPNPDSKILKTTVDSYKKLFKVNPIVRSIHAGLECGLFLEKYPHLDMVSFGPTIKGAHSPDERLDIETTEKFWKHLIDILEKVE